MLHIALTSREFKSLSKGLIYNDIHFTFNRRRREINGSLINQLLNDSNLRAKVRCVKILWAPNARLQPGEGSKEDLELFGQVLPELVGLRTFIWDAQYPILFWLLEALHAYHPRSKLYIRQPPCQDAARALSRLCHIPCLSSLDVVLEPGQFQASRELEKVLLSSPIQDLAIMSPNHTPLQSLLNTSIPLQLRSLEVVGFAFDIYSLPIIWSQFDRLVTNISNLVPEIHSRLDELKSLELVCQDGVGRAGLENLLRNCPSLETLNLTGFKRSVQDWGVFQWQSLGRTLMKLRLHEEGGPNGENATSMYPDSTMVLIARECPKLRSLGTDLDYDGSCASFVSCIF